MSESPRTSQSFSFTNEENALGKKFFVFKAGNTIEAHNFIVKKLSRIGQIEVPSAAECDYILVFCPVVSRVGTDIAEALDTMPPGKPAILVVMHHTFNGDHHPGESQRQVDNPNVCLTVDCLFYEGKLLDCNCNDLMWHNVQRFLQVPDKQLSSLYTSLWQDLLNCTSTPWVVAVYSVAALVILMLIIIIIIITVECV